MEIKTDALLCSHKVGGEKDYPFQNKVNTFNTKMPGYPTFISFIALSTPYVIRSWSQFIH